MKPEVLDFSLTVCEKILRKELQEAKKFHFHVEKALESAQLALGQQDLDVYLSDKDAKSLAPWIGEFGKKGIHFFSDSLMTEGDLRIETPDLLCNLTLARQLESVKKQVLENS